MTLISSSRQPCYQGRKQQRLTWAAGTGVDSNRVWGCAGETESALSTCLLLHLLDEGADSIDRWFPLWIRANDALRPHFPTIRAVYARRGAELAPASQLARAALCHSHYLLKARDEFLREAETTLELNAGSPFYAGSVGYLLILVRSKWHLPFETSR